MSRYYRLLRTGMLFVFTTIFSFTVSLLITGCSATITNGIWSEDCQRTNFTYYHKFDGCTFGLRLFACKGRCSSSVEIPAEIWPPKRSCTCCQNVGEEEVVKMIPSCREENRWLQVKMKQPRRCMCKQCGSVKVVPQEMVLYPNERPINGHFAETEYEQWDK